MAFIKFVSIDKEARKATFDVDGVEVTRRVPAQFEGSIDDYLGALANGLEIEANQGAIVEKVIETPTIKAGETFADVAQQTITQ